MTLASLLSCSLLCRVLSVHFTSLDPHPASDLKHVDLYSGISVGPLFHSARHWFTSCWHNLCLSLSLSRLQTDMLLASCCPLIMKPDEVSAFSIFISFTGILLCPLWTCWGREDLSEPFTDTFKLQCQTDWDLFTVFFFIFLLQLRTGISQHWGLFRQTLHANLNYLSAQDPTKTLHPIPQFLYNKSASRQRAVAAGASFTFSVNKVCC